MAKNYYKTLFKTGYPGKVQFGELVKKAICKAELKKEQQDEENATAEKAAQASSRSWGFR